MATVDTLEIQIQTSAESTSVAIDKLVQRLGIVEKSLKSVGNASNSGFDNMKRMSSSFSTFNSMTNKSNVSISTLANSLSRVYLRVQTLKKGFSALSYSLNNSIGYFENLNYFTKAFEQVAQKADYSSFEEMGYASAEEYAASFMKRANQLTAKMTGFSINTDGMLEDTGGVSLGLNPSDLITQQATFSQMASSMGTTSEQALKLSNVLTMLGADLASVKNMDFDKVWTDMQSGLAGMSRTMDKYGANIRLVNLQLLLNKLGIEQTVSALNQNEKALLRTIAILDATRYSWGDLSETLNQPANQIRVLTANFENLGRMIGNLFVPMISKALPYINGIVIALQRLVTQISEFVGIDLSGITSSVGNVDISGMLGTDEAEEDVNDVTNAVKKLKSTTLGIDELNINAPQGESGGVGLGGIDSEKLNDAFNSIADEYSKVWNDAFVQMNNKSKEFADKIEKIFEPLAKPLKDLFKSVSIGDWFGAGQNVSNIVSGIFDLFSKAIKKVDWEKLGKNIGKFLAGIDWANILKSAFRAIGDILQGVLEGYFGSLSVAPLETITLSLFALSRMNFGKLKGLKDAINSLTKLQKVGIGAVTVFSEFKLLEDGFKNIALGSDNFASSLTQVATSAVSASAILFKLFGPAGFLISGITTAASLLVGFGKAEQEIVERNAGAAIRNALTVPGGMKLEDINQKYSELISNVSNGFVRINDSSANMESTRANIESVWTEIEKIKTQMDAGVISVSDGTAELKRLFEELSNITNTYIGDIENSLIMAFGDNGAFSKYADDLGLNITDALVGAFNITGDMKERVSELALLMSDPNISTEQYIAYQSELASILGKTDELEVALDNFSKNVSAIDLSELFDEKGALNADVLQEKLNELSDTVKSAKKEIDLAGESSRAFLNVLMEQADTEEEKLAVQTLLDAVNLSIEEAKKDVELQANEYGKTIQTALIENTNNIIKKGLEDGERAIDIKNFAGTYFDSAKKAMDLINDELETANLSKDIFDTLMEELFYYDTVKVEGYIVSESNVETVVADNYTDILQNAIDVTLNNTQDDFVNAGKFSTENYAHGLELGQSPVVAKANLISNSAITPFNSVSNTMKNVGFNTISDFTNGMNESATNLYSKCNEIVENMKNIFKGANFGVNIGANAIISKVNIPQYAVGGFPEDGLFMANHNELVGQFTNGRTAVANNEQIVEGIKEGVKEAVGEMLTPYLAYLPDIAQSNREVANKDMSVNIGDREIARANARGQKSLGYALIT